MNLEIQKYIKSMWIGCKRRNNPTIEQINAHLANLIHNMNNVLKKVLKDILLRNIKGAIRAFDSDSVLQFNPLTSEQYNQMPIFRQVKYLLQTLAEHEIKLTAAGFPASFPGKGALSFGSQRISY